MKSKVILILIDGMRPDGFLKCGNPFIHKIMERSSYTLSAKTVYPSMTLPCHLSLFLSVPPQRHGTTTNTYTPPVRPVDGLIDRINTFGGVNAMYYSWEPLRDISDPKSLCFSEYVDLGRVNNTDDYLTERSIERIKQNDPDFVFLYLGETDEKGHEHGWMEEEYLSCISNAISCAEKIYEEFSSTHTIILTADHGGHDRTHGSEDDADMLIPVFFTGESFTPDTVLNDITILDIAPTIAKVMDIPAVKEWEGKPVI